MTTQDIFLWAALFAGTAALLYMIKYWLFTLPEKTQELVERIEESE